MRLAISGWRGMSSKEYLHVFQQAMEDLIVTQNQIPSIVITGGAKGADALGEAWAKEHSIPILVLKPDYTKNGDKAPLIRNTDIINECTHLLAFPHKSGSGTQDAIRKAMKLDKILIIHHL
jgi:YspA, cpYpsA-related SLOG family